jgi:hypothetical protein
VKVENRLSIRVLVNKFSLLFHSFLSAFWTDHEDLILYFYVLEVLFVVLSESQLALRGL